MLLHSRAVGPSLSARNQRSTTKLDNLRIAANEPVSQYELLRIPHDVKDGREHGFGTRSTADLILGMAIWTRSTPAWEALKTCFLKGTPYAFSLFPVKEAQLLAVAQQTRCRNLSHNIQFDVRLQHV